MPFSDPLDDPKSLIQELAKAIEYWTVGALLVGAWIYGIYCGVKTLF